MKSPYCSRTYLFLVFGGLAFIIAATFAVSWLFDFRTYPKAGAYAGGISLLVFMASVLLYGAFHFLKKEESPKPSDGEFLPPELLEVGLLMQNLSVKAGDAESPESFRRSLRSRKWMTFALVFGMAMGLTFAGVWFALTEKPALLWLALGLLPFMMIVLLILAAMESKRTRDRIARLGLTPVASKASEAVEPWPPFETYLAFAGSRQGRPVKLFIGASESFIWIQVPTVEFHVEGLSGDPGPSVPQAARRFLTSLPKLKRWTSIQLEGGPRGIGVSAPNLSGWDWLYDLWLAENLLSKFNG